MLTAKSELVEIVEDMLLQTIDDLEGGFANELWDETTADEFWQEAAQVLPLTGLDRDALYGAELDECVEALREHAGQELRTLAAKVDAKTADGTSVELLRGLVLRTMDRLWIRHLTEIDGLRQGVGLQAYGQQDPLVTYKREAFDMFDQLVAALRREVSASVMHATIRVDEPGAPAPPQRRARGITPATRDAPVRVSNVRESGGGSEGSGGGVAVASRPRARRADKRLGATRPVPAGAGRSTSGVVGRRPEDGRGDGRAGAGGQAEGQAGEIPIPHLADRQGGDGPVETGFAPDHDPRDEQIFNGELMEFGPQALLARFQAQLHAGRPWFDALFDCIRDWESPRETHDGREYVYLIEQEAFDWLLLAERICDSAAPGTLAGARGGIAAGGRIASGPAQRD